MKWLEKVLLFLWNFAHNWFFLEQKKIIIYELSEKEKVISNLDLSKKERGAGASSRIKGFFQYGCLETIDYFKAGPFFCSTSITALIS